MSTTTHADQDDDTRPWWKVTPYDHTAIPYFFVAFVVMTAIWTLSGLAFVEWVEPTGIGEAEIELARDFEDARTDQRNDLALTGSIPSNTPVKIGLMVVLLAILPFVWKRWHDWGFLAAALLLEVSVYGLSSFLVGRPRPPVERLASAPTESWPSGHVAAAVTFYFGLAIIVGWHTDNPVWRWLARLAATAVVIVMAVSRLYLGMHYVSDVVAGVFLGAASLFVALRVIGRSDRPDDENIPVQARRHDLTALERAT